MNTKLLDDSQSVGPLIGPYEMKWNDDKTSAQLVMGQLIITLKKETFNDGSSLWTLFVSDDYGSFSTKQFRDVSPEGCCGKGWSWLTTRGMALSPYSTGTTYQTLIKLIDLMGDRCPECEVFWGSSHKSDCEYNFLERKISVGSKEMSLMNFIKLRKNY